MPSLDLAILVVLSVVIALILSLLFRGLGNLAERKRGDTMARALVDLGSLKSEIQALTIAQTNIHQAASSLSNAVTSLETKMVETTGGVKESLGRELQDARRIVDELKTQLETRHQFENEVRDAARRIEAILAGSQARGRAGENILEEAFRELPPGMIDYAFKVQGKPVEFALILFDGKRLAIDSKWPAPNLILEIDADLSKRAEIMKRIEKAVEDKAREVTKYIDPTTTLPWAIAAIPDSAFALARKAHARSFEAGVIVMSYSMTLPYVLALYRLHLHFARSVDLGNLESFIEQIARAISEVEAALENKISRGGTMVTNAYFECKGLISEIRTALNHIRSLPVGAIPETIGQLDGVEENLDSTSAGAPEGLAVNPTLDKRQENPARFLKGDKVYVKSLQKIGIIDGDPRQIKGSWMYSVATNPSEPGQLYPEDALEVAS